MNYFFRKFQDFAKSSKNTRVQQLKSAGSFDFTSFFWRKISGEISGEISGKIPGEISGEISPEFVQNCRPPQKLPFFRRRVRFELFFRRFLSSVKFSENKVYFGRILGFYPIFCRLFFRRIFRGNLWHFGKFAGKFWRIFPILDNFCPNLKFSTKICPKMLSKNTLCNTLIPLGNCDFVRKYQPLFSRIFQPIFRQFWTNFCASAITEHFWHKLYIHTHYWNAPETVIFNACWKIFRKFEKCCPTKNNAFFCCCWPTQQCLMHSKKWRVTPFYRWFQPRKTQCFVRQFVCVTHILSPYFLSHFLGDLHFFQKKWIRDKLLVISLYDHRSWCMHGW